MKVPSKSKLGILISAVLGLFGSSAEAASRTCTGMYHYYDSAGGFHTPTISVSGCPEPRSGYSYNLVCKCDTVPTSGASGNTMVTVACWDDYDSGNPGESFGTPINTFGTVTFDRCFASQ